MFQSSSQRVFSVISVSTDVTDVIAIKTFSICITIHCFLSLLMNIAIFRISLKTKPTYSHVQPNALFYYLYNTA